MIALILPAALVTVVGFGFLFWQAADAKVKEADERHRAEVLRIENAYEATIDRLELALAKSKSCGQLTESGLRQLVAEAQQYARDEETFRTVAEAELERITTRYQLVPTLDGIRRERADGNDLIAGLPVNVIEMRSAR